MTGIRNQKGVILISSYIVVLIILGLATAFFFRTVHETKLVQRQNYSLKAFYSAEKGVAYAYFESADKGWTWFTHKWDGLGNLVPLSTPPASMRTQGANVDAYFITSGDYKGCYAAIDGSFILKAFPDPKVANVTVVRVMGINGNINRAIEYRISRSAIYDYAWWTPYSLNLNSVGDSINGGRIHSNGNIYMYNSKRLYGVDTITTGKNKSVYYAWENYYGPGNYDWYADGSGNINGKVAVPNLGKADVHIPNGGWFRRWAGTTGSDTYQTQTPWLYKGDDNLWHWRSYGYEHAGYWPPRDWRDEEFSFYGDSQARYNTTVDGKLLNTYNAWIYAAKRDAGGNILFDESGNIINMSAEQIPAELEGAMWDWTKYTGTGKIGGKAQQAISFTVYDPATGQSKPVEDTRWKIVTDAYGAKSVVMVNPSQGGVTYWEMLKSYDYWRALGYSDADAKTYSTHINPEIMDGTYGTEVPAGQTTIKVDNTYSMKQPEAWNQFLASSGLDDVIMANERGEDMEAPRFATTYKEKSKNTGLYLSNSGGTQTLNYGGATPVTYTAHTCGAIPPPSDPSAYQQWLDCMEQSIDVLVSALNTDAEGNNLPAEKQTAKKVKFINTYTNKWNVVLELDLGKMKTAGTFPAGGIIYSEVPVRLTNAQQLPYLAEANNSSFNVIGEENIYLKGDFNNPSTDSQWMASAIITEKQIYTLSNDFNDPQVSPALVNYPNYPYVYVKTDAGGNFIEADPKAGGGQWVYYGWYLPEAAQRTQALNLMNAINSDWRATFEKKDPSGSSLYTVSSSHPVINGQTWGAMPNRVQDNYTYNCLLASYYYGDDDGIPYGVSLERWKNDSGSTRTKRMKGAYFQLDYGDEADPDRFAAHQSDGPVDFFYYAGYNSRSSSRVSGSPYWGPYYMETSPNNPRAYDARFRNPQLAKNKGIFFGGGDASWREIIVAVF